MEQGNAVGGLDSPLQGEIKVCRWHSLSNLAKQVKFLWSFTQQFQLFSQLTLSRFSCSVNLQ